MGKGLKIRKSGNYDRGDFKLTVMLAIKCGNAGVLTSQIGSVDNPRIWCCNTEDAGTLAELIMCCPPNSPQDGPVELLINQASKWLEKWWSIRW